MCRILGVAACALWLCAPAAHAHWVVKAKMNGSAQRTEFEIHCHDQCDYALEITAAGQTVGTSPSYAWSCARTGRHEWSVTLFSKATGEAASTDRGTFEVGRCEPRRPFRVTRRRAEAYAAFERGYVARLSCRGLDGRRRASRWQCEARDYDSSGFCVRTFRLRYTARTRFGKRSVKTSWRQTRKQCKKY